jgi:hypothetical protein
MAISVTPGYGPGGNRTHSSEVKNLVCRLYTTDPRSFSGRAFLSFVSLHLLLHRRRNQLRPYLTFRTFTLRILVLLTFTSSQWK